MSSSAFTARAEQPWPSAEPAAPMSGDDRGLLEHVLRETLAASDADDVIDDAEREALRAIATRHANVELSLEPVARELVAGLLAAKFRCLACPADVWEGLAVPIARTLWEDPTCRARLQSLWTRLTEATE